jgi:hypothetical protein
MSVKLGDSAPLLVAADSRTQIVTALATVPSLTASPQVPDVPTEGAAWPVWVQTTFDGVLALPGRGTFDVYALLPAGYIATTVETADGLLGQLVRALWALCVVQLAEPVTVRFDNQTQMPGLRLRVIMRGSNPNA